MVLKHPLLSLLMFQILQWRNLRNPSVYLTRQKQSTALKNPPIQRVKVQKRVQKNEDTQELNDELTHKRKSKRRLKVGTQEGKVFTLEKSWKGGGK